MIEEVKHMDVKEFLDEGYLQEANRRFFHPLGLALEACETSDGTIELGGIWDYRENPAGISYAPSITRLEKFKSRAKRFDELLAEKLSIRQELLGYGILEPSEE